MGIGIPISLLVAYELYAQKKKLKTPQFENFEMMANQKSEEPDDDSSSGNKRGGKVIGIGVAATGLLIFILSLLADTGATLVGGMGTVVILLGGYVIFKNRPLKKPI